MKKLIFFASFYILTSTLNLFGQNKNDKENFTSSFNLEGCTFVTNGSNPYFILEPGYELILEGKDGKDSARLVITVLNETRKIGDIETRVVVEHESVNGEVIEISRNYFAFCKQTGSIFYFGEDVDMYKNGKVDNHSGSWIATGNNKPGIAMPGQILLGARYYQEIAPGIAMDRAEIINAEEILKTPSGEFKNVLKTQEGTALEPKEKEFKYYATGIGLIKDEELLLVKYGFKKE